MARDPHAGAGRLLRDSDSRAIVNRLDPEAANEPIVHDNVLRTRCISCHTSATTEDCAASGELDASLLHHGVTCRSCHGSAEKWLEPHMRVDWSGPERFEAATGMRDTESIQGRASTCVRCHVGSRSEDGVVRDMNHDLIAAGHPALRFDLLIYNDNLPKHWDVEGEAEQQFAASAVRIRRVGRAMNLAAAASLASQRASDHLQDRSAVPWPELSDYDCFACHQSLSIREYSLPPRRTGQMKSPLHVSDGLPVWNSWHTVGNELEIRGNRRALETLSPHRSDPAQIATLAEQIADRFRQKASERAAAPVTAEQVAQLARQSIDSVRDQLQQSAPVDWHQAAMQYLELDAAARDLSRSPEFESLGQRMSEALTEIEQWLRFESEEVSYRKGRLHSPAHFDPDVFRSRLLNLLDQWTADRSPSDQTAIDPTTSPGQET